MIPNPVAMSTPTSLYYPRQQDQMEALSPIAYCRLPDYMVNNKVRSPQLTHRRNQLSRPSIHSYLNSPQEVQQSPVMASANMPSVSLKARLMSAIGINPYSSMPPGLVNAGQNICFLNCLLQCLAYTPAILDCLRHDLQQLEREKKNGVGYELLLALTDLLNALNVKPGSSDVLVLDAVKLRILLSAETGSVIEQPSKSGTVTKRQLQQDCSEVLMWILDKLHQILNRSKQPGM